MKKVVLLLLASIVGDIYAENVPNIPEDFYVGTEIHQRHLIFNYDRQSFNDPPFTEWPRMHNAQTYHTTPQSTVIVGYKLTPHFSIEGGAHRSQTRGLSMTETKHHLRGTYVSLIALRDIYGLKFIIGGGVSNLKSVFKNSKVRKYHYKKSVPRFVVGFQMDPTDGTTLRFSYIVEQASRLFHRNPSVDITPRDAFAFGTGIFYNF